MDTGAAILTIEVDVGCGYGGVDQVVVDGRCEVVVVGMVVEEVEVFGGVDTCCVLV